MEQMERRVKALHAVTEAAKIHADSLIKEVEGSGAYGVNDSFKKARTMYVGDLRGHIRVLESIKFDGETKLHERLQDLDLEASVDLLLAVEDHIRDLRRFRETF